MDRMRQIEQAEKEGAIVERTSEADARRELSAVETALSGMIAAASEQSGLQYEDTSKPGEYMSGNLVDSLGDSSGQLIDQGDGTWTLQIPTRFLKPETKGERNTLGTTVKGSLVEVLAALKPTEL